MFVFWRIVCVGNVVSLGLTLSVFLLGCVDFSGGGPGTDKIEIIAEEKSPNGKLIATSFSCSGGGAVGYFYFNASFRKRARNWINATAFWASTRHGKPSPIIEVKWIDDENLEVAYKQTDSPDYKEDNAVKVESKYGIKIHYKVKKGKP
jgi:hypothetical protein